MAVSKTSSYTLYMKTHNISHMAYELLNTHNTTRGVQTLDNTLTYEGLPDLLKAHVLAINTGIMVLIPPPPLEEHYT